MNIFAMIRKGYRPLPEPGQQQEQGPIFDDELAPEPAGCPVCGERRMDWLVNRDGVVTCQSCGHVYDLEPDRDAATA